MPCTGGGHAQSRWAVAISGGAALESLDISYNHRKALSDVIALFQPTAIMMLQHSLPVYLMAEEDGSDVILDLVIPNTVPPPNSPPFTVVP